MTSNLQCYDDYIAAVRYTPRDVMHTDVEILWLLNADAKEGKDYKPERVMALWDITMLEDQWIVENNHLGIKSVRIPQAATRRPKAISPGSSNCTCPMS